jgi:hypothetical protein
MKAIKNKKRFDPRRFLSERKEETKKNVEKTNANFNDFSFDNWLEEGSVKEIQISDGAAGEYKQRPTPTSTLNQNNQKDKKEEFKGDPLKDYEEGTGQSPVGRDGKPVVYEEGCGDPEMGPEEPQAVPADLSPDEAFGAGYTAAVEEIMASIQGLLEDPMDMGPAGEEEESALVVTQLPEAEEHEDGRSADPITTLEKEWDVSMNKVKSSSVDNDADYLLNVIGGVTDSGYGEIPVVDYIESRDEEDIDALIDHFQDEKETLKSQKPHIYKLIMAIIKKRASAPRIRDFDAEDRKMQFRDDAIDDDPRYVEGRKLEES